VSIANSSIYPLAGNQRNAANPADNVWLSASAGTGKTQVLSARVLRLLLTDGVNPSQILCLTFTKAGAAEMANRVNAVLARWVRLPDAILAKELGFLGADFGPHSLLRARSLFASVLDCPGGGLKINTIHGFAQFLIASFPEESGLAPGLRVMEDRSREVLARGVLADLVTAAEQAGDARLIDAITLFTLRKQPDVLLKWLLRAADHHGMWEGPPGWQTPMDARVRQLLGIPADADEDWAREPLHPDIFPDHQLAAMLPTLDAWSAKTGASSAAFIRHWFTLEVAVRATAAAEFRKTLLKADGTPRVMEAPAKRDPQFPSRQQEIADAVATFEARRGLLACARIVTAALEIGRAFALRWQERKASEGLVDYGDLIRKAALLLEDSDAAEWIRYKLDRRFDHILIDEAQDTNAEQWDIIFALIDDFFAGESARGDALRTIFTVGDYKQAIFGFQGTSPENFDRAKAKVKARIMALRDAIRAGRVDRAEPGWQDLDLDRSFRTADIVLQFVNRAIAALGPQSFGLDTLPPLHRGDDRAGMVTLWSPVVPAAGTGNAGVPDEEVGDGEGGEAVSDDGPDWLARHETLLADTIAEQVRRWVTGEAPIVLEKDGRRHAGAGDIMVLVRKRSVLAAQIVARLYACGVPVAGVDRLRLGAPLAVKDLMAALRFAAQPLDDLMLANLLASPLIGWSQDDILAHVPRPDGVFLWNHLRRGDAPARVAETAEALRALLARADFQTPEALLGWILTGPLQGRARLVERLGTEANDPIDELVNAAFAYEADHWPSLAGFIGWFDSGTGDLKRDADRAEGQVRVMTVHGSKGLQAPVVILADAAGAPGKPGDLALEEEPWGIANSPQEPSKVPLPPLSKAEHLGAVALAAEIAARTALEEHWRLLYVAMTRAEEALFITGSMSEKMAKKGPPEQSWYAQLAPLFPDPAEDDPLWGHRREWGCRAAPLGPVEIGAQPVLPPLLPDWMTTLIGPEPRPPRPLAPSQAGEDAGADPPLAPEASRDAARRGSLIHALLERLPDVPEASRAVAAARWLARQAGDWPEDARAELLESALAVFDHPGFAALFSPLALAEVPLAAKVGGLVVAGTADRLLIESAQVTVVDFKTTRRPPASLADIPVASLRQMAAYVAALEAIYPGRAVRAGLLYTHTPVLFELPGDLLARHKQGLELPQQSYAPRPLA
jgi:ATP-dependent helicase/nuclease subunit A